jgi:hypothetical protein
MAQNTKTYELQRVTETIGKSKHNSGLNKRNSRKGKDKDKKQPF